jgi:hypothetical protein
VVLVRLFMAGKGSSTPQEYQTPGNIPSEVINDIARWMRSAVPAAE